MLRLQVRMEFAPRSYGEAVAVLRSLLGPIRAEPGCASTRLLGDVDADSALTWLEEWRNAADFERHLQAATFRSFLAVMNLAAARPEVEIDDVADRRGFDLVEEMLARVKHQRPANVRRT